MRSLLVILVMVLACVPAGAFVAESTDSAAASQQETWGTFDAGKGFQVAKSEMGTLSISGYILIRYLNQLPPEQTFTDHLGGVHVIDPRADIQLHREMIWFKGWVYSPKLTYTLQVWGLNSLNMTATPGMINYEFSKKLTIGGGIEGLPGIRSLNGQHPYLLGTDRQMAEDFFKPGFTSGIWARGEFLPRAYYRVMIGDNLSQVGINAAQMTRDHAYGASIWWLPTTGEFGPRGGFGDYEMHEKLATRFGLSTTYSREDRYNEINQQAPENTQIRMSDGVFLFQTGALAPGATVEKADYHILSVDGATKYQGFFAHMEYYFRKLSRFQSQQPLPIDSMLDHGFGIQVAHQIKPKKLELYGTYSQIFGHFNRASEVAVGGNHYPFDTRNFRLNGSLAYLDHSPIGSLFGYYVAGQTGPTIALSADLLF